MWRGSRGEGAGPSADKKSNLAEQSQAYSRDGSQKGKGGGFGLTDHIYGGTFSHQGGKKKGRVKGTHLGLGRGVQRFCERIREKNKKRAASRDQTHLLFLKGGNPTVEGTKERNTRKKNHKFLPRGKKGR